MWVALKHMLGRNIQGVHICLFFSLKTWAFEDIVMCVIFF